MNATEKTYIFEKLAERGYTEIKEKQVIKNGLEMTATIIKVNGSSGLAFYLDNAMENPAYRTLDNIVDYICDTIKNSNLQINMDDLLNRDFLLENVYLEMQMQSDEKGLIKLDTDFEDIETFVALDVVVNGESVGITKVTEEMLERAGLTREDILFAAQKNMFAHTCIDNISKLIGFDLNPDVPLYVVYNKKYLRGAASILDKGSLHMFGVGNNLSKVYAIPSSINEFILVPYNKADYENISGIINMVNKTEVDRREWLGNKPYVLDI